MSPIKIVTIVMLVALMLDAGLQADRQHLVAALKNYGLVGKALLANFVIVPVVGVLLARFFQLETSIATGFLLMTIAPGVPFLVKAAGRQPGGSLGFAIALAFLMPALSVVTIPITAGLVLPQEVQAQLPLAKTLITLVLFQLVPLLIGMLIADRAPTIAAKLGRPLTLLFFVAVLAFFVLVGPALIKAVTGVYGSRAMLAEFIAVLISVGVGWLLGGPEAPYRRTLGIATGLRNVGICAMIATTVFPDSLVAPAVLTYLIIQIIVTVIFRVIFQRQAAAAST